MKKVLIATTALVATAGMAAAELKFGGYGRFGVLYSEAASSTDLTSRFRVQIDASAESDGGVVFGARTRLEGESRDAVAGNRPQLSGVRYFARSGGLEVGVGNIFGALDSMPGQYPIDLGLTGLSYRYSAINVGGYDAFNSGGLGAAGFNGVEVMFSAGDFGVHVSASDINDRVAAHVSYSFNGWTVAVGAQDSTAANDVETTIAVGGSLGDASVNLAWAETNAGADRTSLVVGYAIGAATGLEFYASDESAVGSSFGIGFRHDLGGGTSIEGGYDDNAGNALVDLGVRFNF